MTLRCQNGWPLLDPHGQNSNLIHTWDIKAHNGELRLTYRQGSIGLILSHCALSLSERVEDLTMFDSKHNLIVDDWGLAIRPVRGQTDGYSNHGGYAFDANSTRHPLGRVGTFTPAQTLEIRRMLKKYDGVIRWGGDYHLRKDEMHWEINDNVTMREAELVARRLMTTPRGERILAANRGQKSIILS